jgi:repressor LexA
MNTLTKRQKEILDFITAYLKENGYAPSFEEIKAKFGLSALSTVHEHLTALVDKGYLKRDEKRERGIYLPNKPKQYLEVPLVGSIACGEPLEAIEETGETVKVARERSLTGHLYALKAKGDSMIGEGIFDGDIIIIKKQHAAENGDTVVGIIDDNEATLKKYFKEKKSIRLQPANPAFKPMYRKHVEVRGIVVKIIRNLK